ncbi:Integrin alpha-V [Varanus komodoensis]|nr:Integrin alpha-V [Varanus komodoensis]
MAGIALLFLASLLLAPGSAFNLDVERPTVYTGPAGSYFGFAVDFFVPDRSSMFLLVGAPKANTTQPGIVQGGQVLKCNWNSNRGDCQPILFDPTGLFFQSPDPPHCPPLNPFQLDCFFLKLWCPELDTVLQMRPNQC